MLFALSLFATTCCQSNVRRLHSTEILANRTFVLNSQRLRGNQPTIRQSNWAASQANQHSADKQVLKRQQAAAEYLAAERWKWVKTSRATNC